MRRSVSVQNLIYSFLFPRPISSDPPNFSHHLTRNLIPEIRIETAQFYGGLEETEARYPGLDYTHGPHIRRLSFFPHHARLFRAIRVLGITDKEVLDLARWEGTLWAKERFERDEGIKITDTTGDGIGPWLDPRKDADVVRGSIVRKERHIVLSGLDCTEVVTASSAACDTEGRPDAANTSVTSTQSVAAVSATSPQEPAPDSSISRLETVRDLRSARNNSFQRPTQTRIEPQGQTTTYSATQSTPSARRQPLRMASLPPGLDAAIQELIDSWHALQTARGLSDADMSRFRADIFQRIAQLQTDVPASLNIATVLQMYLEHGLGTELHAPETESPATHTSQVITQPAA